MSNQVLYNSAALQPEPDDAFDLEDAEHDGAETLAVWAFRRWVLGLRLKAPEQWDAVLWGLRRRCGEAAGREAAAALAEMVEGLRRTSRRTITHHQPCCADLGDDEATLLVLLAACQRGDILLAETAAQTLSGTLHTDEVTLAAMRFAEAFFQRGLMLPYRDLPPAAKPPSAASIH